MLEVLGEFVLDSLVQNDPYSFQVHDVLSQLYVPVVQDAVLQLVVIPHVQGVSDIGTDGAP